MSDPEEMSDPEVISDLKENVDGKRRLRKHRVFE